MKKLFLMRPLIQISLILLLVQGLSSCKKSSGEPKDCPGEPRKVRFVLYTTKNFSGMDANVLFTLSIKNQGRVVWDSLLPPIKLRDIPGFSNRIIVEKTIPNDVHAPLRAGFVYAIENVGISWFIDDVDPCITHKEIDFNFQ